MEVPSELQYSENHVWIKVLANQAKVGITDFAQCELGDIVFVELPHVGDVLQVGEPFGSAESVKSVTEFYAPVSGRVVQVNELLHQAPAKVNDSPYEEGWMIVVELSELTDLQALWSSEQYAQTYGV